MFVTYVLASILAVSSVLGGPNRVDLPQMELSYKSLNVQREEKEMSATMGMEPSAVNNEANDDRSSNLKFVATIQKSSIWNEIKDKTLTIKTQVDGKMIERDPKSLSDQELYQLKKACHDGLKCVAVDQLIVLKTVKEPSTDDGNSEVVRTAITKITKVITDYTTEYHEDKYQYSEVTESDDPSKVYQSVITILEDNRELCKIDAVSIESSAANNDTMKISEPVDATGASKNNIVRNYGTIDNYYVNKDTVNVANINILPSDDEKTNKNVSKPGASANSDDRSKNINQEKSVQGKENTPSSAILNNADPKNSNATRETAKSVDQTNNKRSKPLGGEQNADQDENAKDSKTTVDSSPVVSSDAKAPAENTNSRTNSVNMNNPGGAGKSSLTTDITSSGSSSKQDVKKGYVLKGMLNNGGMQQYNQNHGVVTEGEISNVNANNGTISIGTINQGPVTYSTNNDNSSNKKVLELNNLDVDQFAKQIVQTYSRMLSDFSKQ